MVVRFGCIHQTLRYWPWDISCSDSLTLSVFSLFSESKKWDRKSWLVFKWSSRNVCFMYFGVFRLHFCTDFNRLLVPIFSHRTRLFLKWNKNSVLYVQNHVLATHFCRTHYASNPTQPASINFLKQTCNSYLFVKILSMNHSKCPTLLSICILPCTW